MNESSSQKDTKALIIGFICIGVVLVFFTIQHVRKPEQNSQQDMTSSANPSPNEAVQDKRILSAGSLRDQERAKNQKWAYLDIRPADMFVKEHIPQSKNIPLNELPNVTLPATQVPIVIIASDGDENGLAVNAADIVEQKTSAQVVILQGGFDGWKKNGEPTITIGDPASFADQAKISSISSEDLKKFPEKNLPFLVLDMRPKEVFAQGHVPGALNLPLNQLENYYSSLPSDKKLIVYGNSALEDFQAGVRLFDLHFFTTQVLKGGFEDWKNKGFPVESAEK